MNTSNQFRSIKDKFSLLNQKILFWSLLSSLLCVFSLTAYGLWNLSDDYEQIMQEKVMQEGQIVTKSLQLALVGMVQDNEFGSVNELIASTVKSNSTIVYGIFIDYAKNVWVDTTKESPNILSYTTQKYEDPLSRWADSLTKPAVVKISNKDTQTNPQLAEFEIFDPLEPLGPSLIEFAAPVYAINDKLGTVRLGFDLTLMHQAIQESKSALIQLASMFLLALTAMSLFILFLGRYLNKKQAESITKPLNILIGSTHRVASGLMDEPIIVNSNDEVGQLANAFEIMRQKVSESTQVLEQKVHERTQALVDLQAQAIDDAHRAGMADIATGTLHNVGNVLNSVTTSTELITQLIDRSRLKGMKQANELLRSKLDTLDDFIINDPKGKILLEYYLRLGDEMIAEQNHMKLHVQRLDQKITVINEAIRAQQAYAVEGKKVYSEQVNLYQVIQDTLMILSTHLVQSMAQVSVHCVKGEIVKGQKNKIIQVLVNIFANALEAMETQLDNDRHIHVNCEVHNNILELRITDTGPGIKKNDLIKVFQYGFTTKASGHGFGLHSSANALQEMGGALWAEEQDTSRGACLVLQFNKA